MLENIENRVVFCKEQKRFQKHFKVLFSQLRCKLPELPFTLAVQCLCTLQARFFTRSVHNLLLQILFFPDHDESTFYFLGYSVPELSVFECKKNLCQFLVISGFLSERLNNKALAIVDIDVCRIYTYIFRDQDCFDRCRKRKIKSDR